tara:strand:+ start:1717 stop:2238 length:522 start_codon:yes stop_codon:yes gene_type:complete
MQMPIPKPEKNEDNKKFLSRCMGDKTMKEEYGNPKQRMAVCLSQSKGSSLIEEVHNNLLATNMIWDEEWDEFTYLIDLCDEENIYDEDGKILGAEYQGRKVTLNKPFLTPKGPKKRSVYVKNEKGNVVKVNFGDPNMRIKKSDPARRKSFRARHNCSNPGPKWKARYWSCKAW